MLQGVEKMIHFKPLFLLMCVALFVPTASAAHEVYLKNGAVIKTDYFKREKGRLTYRLFGGDVSISLSEVDRIIYTNSQSTSPVQATQSLQTDTAAGNGSHDLKTSLEARLSPQGPIEIANIAVVSITTVSGSGSGFFINDDGLIVTNRHVIRGSEGSDRQLDQAIAEASGQLAQWEKNLKREKTRIDQYQEYLRGEWADYKQTVREYGDQIKEDRRLAAENALKKESRYLKTWQKDYNRRRESYLQEKRLLDRQRDHFKQSRVERSHQSRFTITLADGEDKSAILYRISDRHDLALLKLNGYKTPYLRVAEVGSMKLGQQVYAIGSPLQLNNSVTSGVISNFRGDYIQTNSEIYPGNSGGPLVTADGLVVGVNTMKLITEKFEGLGFALNITEVLTEFPDFFPNQ